MLPNYPRKTRHLLMTSHDCFHNNGKAKILAFETPSRESSEAQTEEAADFSYETLDFYFIFKERHNISLLLVTEKRSGALWWNNISICEVALPK